MANIKTVIVLGANGMLGAMVYGYLGSNKSLNVIGTTRNKNNSKYKFFDAKEFNNAPYKFKFLAKADYIINTVGIIKPFCKVGNNEGTLDAILVNSAFPYQLSKYLNLKNSKTKIINIATDCVFSGKNGRYTEKSEFSPQDVYDKTKNLGEIKSKNTLNIRCSIIGPQTNHSENLMQWFLNQSPKNSVNGFSDHYWNGVTTLQFSKLIERIIIDSKFQSLRKENYVLHFVPNDTVTKFKLLGYINKSFNKKITINKIKSPNGKLDRSLKTIYPSLTNLYGKSTIRKEINDMKNYIDRYER